MTEVFTPEEGLRCDNTFTLAVTSMDYVDAVNVAVVVVHTTLEAPRRLGGGTECQARTCLGSRSWAGE
eukprot:2079894-Rhodomonas_salina.1